MHDPTSFPAVQWLLFLMQVGTLVLIAVYVLKTWQMAEANTASAKTAAATLEELRAERRARVSPRILVYFSSPESHLAQLVLENAGESTATDVTVQFDPPLQASNGNGAAAFVESSKVLPPRSRMTHLFDSWPAYFGKDLPLRYTAIVRYRVPGGDHAVEEQQVVDVGGFQHIRFTRQYGFKELTEEVSKLRQLLERYGQEHLAEIRARNTKDELLSERLPGHVAVDLAEEMWNLRSLLESTDWVTHDSRGFYDAMRTVVARGLAHSATEPDAAAAVDALKALYAKLSDIRLLCIGDCSEQEAAIRGAFSTAREALTGGIQKGRLAEAVEASAPGLTG